MDGHRRPLLGSQPTRDVLPSFGTPGPKGLLQRPRPDTFWGIQSIIILAWCILCITAVVDFLPKMEKAAADLLLLYFQPVLPILFMLWLWACNVRNFEAMSVEYEKCFSGKERKYLIPPEEVFKLALLATAVVATFAAGFTWSCATRMYIAAHYMPLGLYFSLLALMVAPVNVLHKPMRLFFSKTIQRVLVPFQEVTWSDFLLADVMTSLSKSTSDSFKVFCAFVTGPIMKTLAVSTYKDSSMCAPLAFPVLFALCLPYTIRFIQCLSVYRQHGKVSQLFNALKYSSAFPALILSAVEHEYHLRKEPFPYWNWWIPAMLINSLYSFYWDIEMDWDMPWLVNPGMTKCGPLRFPRIKPDSLYTLPWYVWAMVSNLALRLTWTHRLLGNLENHVTVGLAVALLEAFRRYQWIYIRVETELRKKKMQAELHTDAEENSD